MHVIINYNVQLLINGVAHAHGAAEEQGNYSARNGVARGDAESRDNARTLVG